MNQIPTTVSRLLSQADVENLKNGIPITAKDPFSDRLGVQHVAKTQPSRYISVSDGGKSSARPTAPQAYADLYDRLKTAPYGPLAGVNAGTVRFVAATIKSIAKSMGANRPTNEQLAEKLREGLGVEPGKDEIHIGTIDTARLYSDRDSDQPGVVLSTSTLTGVSQQNNAWPLDELLLDSTAIPKSALSNFSNITGDR